MLDHGSSHMEVRAAPRVPLIGGIGLDAFKLSHQIDQIRDAIVRAAQASD